MPSTPLKDTERRADKWKAAHEFWQEMRDGMAETFVEGMPEPLHAEHVPVGKK